MLREIAKRAIEADLKPADEIVAVTAVGIGWRIRAMTEQPSSTNSLEITVHIAETSMCCSLGALD